MKTKRNLAIEILIYLYKHTKFYFPFLVICKEPASESNDFVKRRTKERKNIKEDKSYQTFELRENLQNLNEDTNKLLAI
jgi:hypothetical protein